MKRLTSFLILAMAMTISGSVLAQHTSTSADNNGWNNAEMELTVDGTVIDHVEFQVPSATLTLDYGALSPQQRFFVIVPVTNNTDRAIYVDEDDSNPYIADGAGIHQIEFLSGEVRIPPGATRNMRWKVTVGDNAAENPNGSYQTTFGLVASGDVPDIVNQVFGN